MKATESRALNGARAAATGETPPCFESKRQGSQAKERVLPPNGHAIEAVGLTKHFGDLVAVDRVSFGARKGEICPKNGVATINLPHCRDLGKNNVPLPDGTEDR